MWEEYTIDHRSKTRINKGLLAVCGIVLFVLLLWWFAASEKIDILGSIENVPVLNLIAATTTQPYSSGVQRAASAPSKAKPSASAAGAVIDSHNLTVAEIALHTAGSAQFALWLNSTGVVSQIKSGGPYTIFVPTDGAIGQLPKGTITQLSAAAKKRLVQYHIVSGRAVDADAMSAGAVQALSGDPLNFNYGTNKIPMVNNSIIVTEYTAKNGVVYVISGVLFPPTR